MWIKPLKWVKVYVFVLHNDRNIMNAINDAQCISFQNDDVHSIAHECNHGSGLTA